MIEVRYVDGQRHEIMAETPVEESGVEPSSNASESDSGTTQSGAEEE